ncbi:MAG: OsmC family protein [Capsulimonadaceae bacterium]|nr:OsmC family protein [Capsulimonadaceae bacterium]
MVSMRIKYDGNKGCTLTHEDSGAVIQTSAPKDIGGDGNAFSPTDLVGAALASCILTTIAMFAERNNIDLAGSSAHVTKEMTTDAPRRIGRLVCTVTVPGDRVPEGIRERIEKIAHTCPVHKSLHPEIDAPITFIYE